MVGPMSGDLFSSKTQDLSHLGQQQRRAILFYLGCDGVLVYFSFFPPSLFLSFQNDLINWYSVFGNPFYSLSLNKKLICSIQVSNLSHLSRLSICFIVSCVLCRSFIKKEDIQILGQEIYVHGTPCLVILKFIE